jgi:PAS domain S-box-containing protein
VEGAADAASTLEAFAAEDDLSILIWDAELTVRAAYGGLHARSPRLRGRVVGRHVDDVLPPDPYAGLSDLLRGALAGGGGGLEVTSATGEHHYRITVNPVHEGTRIVGCMSVSRDVTRQHDDGLLLAELTEVFGTAFDRSPSGQALLSPTGQWLRVNDALRRLLGRGEDELLGASLRDVTHHDDTAREQALLREVLAGDADGYEIEKRFVRGGGTTVRAFVRMSPIRAVDGAVRGFVAHVVDADRWEPVAGD